ncbi:MAG: copper-translocating P-type ATPase [Pseudomonadota bacterium]
MSHHHHETHQPAGHADAHHQEEHACHHSEHGEKQGAVNYNCGGGAVGHEGHHRMMIKEFKKRFWISFVLTIPILFLSPMIQEFLHYTFTFTGVGYVMFVLSTVVFFYGGWPFLKGTYDEVSAGAPGMMTLIGVAITAAYVYSVAVIFGLHGKTFLWELVTLIDIMLLGHWIEMNSILGASRSLELLVQMMPSVAHVVKDGSVEDVHLEKLQVGDIVLVRPGEKLPADGTVIEGVSYINESMLTGESKPVKREVGNEVIGASLNGNGSLKVKVKHTGKDSYLSKVIHLVQEAQKAKSKTQHLADRAAKWLTFVAITVGLITLIVWVLAGEPMDFILERVVTVMVISCPHALGLAIPLVVAISTALSAQHGLLIRNRTAFENSRKITTLVFDKTGTLTKGEFGVVRYESLNGDYSKDDVLRYAASLEQHSEHPIAAGVVKFAKNKSLQLWSAQGAKAMTGRGIEGTVEGKQVKVVSLGYLKEHKIEVDLKIFESKAETIIFVLMNDVIAGVIALADEIRPESFEAIKSFKVQGIKTMMITGDNEEVAKSVSDALGLDGYYANILPHDKLAIVKELQKKGEFVAMAGDGVNDSPALAQADVGIAVGSGTDIAAETADIILVESNPQDILSLILFGKATYRKMIQNLIWATGYNTVALPLAAGVLYPWGIVLSPAMGAVLMSLSTVIVAFNAQLLKRAKGIR